MYGNLEEDGMGLFSSYLGETREKGTLERLLDLAANQDSAVYTISTQIMQKRLCRICRNRSKR